MQLLAQTEFYMHILGGVFYDIHPIKSTTTLN